MKKHISGHEFEWDEDKEHANRLKHHLSFDTAALVFNDPERLELFDEGHSCEGEDRYIAIGKVCKVLFVVFTERGKYTRIISARLATAREKEAYYGNTQNVFD